MDDHLIINLRVGDTRYPLKVKRSEEEIYRRAADEIDYKLGQYKRYFAGDSTHVLYNENYVVMTAIQAVGGKAEHQLRAELYESKLKSLALELDKYLDSL